MSITCATSAIFQLVSFYIHFNVKNACSDTVQYNLQTVICNC